MGSGLWVQVPPGRGTLGLQALPSAQLDTGFASDSDKVFLVSFCFVFPYFGCGLRNASRTGIQL